MHPVSTQRHPPPVNGCSNEHNPIPICIVLVPTIPEPWNGRVHCFSTTRWRSWLSHLVYTEKVSGSNPLCVSHLDFFWLKYVSNVRVYLNKIDSGELFVVCLLFVRLWRLASVSIKSITFLFYSQAASAVSLSVPRGNHHRRRYRRRG